MTSAQDRPDGPEMLIALAQWLHEDLLPTVGPAQRFHVRVAANTCAILAREWEAEIPAAERERRRAAAHELAAEIRAGEHDDRWSETLTALRESVKAKLDVAHPGYSDFTPDD